MSKNEIKQLNAISEEVKNLVAGLEDPDESKEETKFDFSPEWQNHCLQNIIHDEKLCVDAINTIKSNPWQDEIHIFIWSNICKYRNEYQHGDIDTQLHFLREAVSNKIDNIKTAESKMYWRGRCETLLDGRLIPIASREYYLKQIKIWAVKSYRISACIDFCKDKDYAKFKETLSKIDSIEKIDKAKKTDFTIEELFALPEDEYLIEKHIPHKALSFLIAPPSSAKTFFALDMALSVCTGKMFLNHFNVMRGNAIYVVSEGKNGFKRRIKAWMNSRNIIDPPINFIANCEVHNLLDKSNADKVLEKVKMFPANEPLLVVIDTLSKNFGGGDENGSKDMGAFIDNVFTIKDTHENVSILVVHHCGKEVGKGARGHSLLLGAADSMIQIYGRLTNSIETDELSVVCEKQKDDEPFKTYYIRPERVEVGNGGNSLSLRMSDTPQKVDKTDEEWHRILSHCKEAIGKKELYAAMEWVGKEGRNILEQLEKVGLLTITRSSGRENIYTRTVKGNDFSIKYLEGKIPISG